MRTILFTTTACPKCPEAKKWAKENIKNVELKEVDTNLDVLKMVSDLGIRTVPTFVRMGVNKLDIYTFDEYRAKYKK